VPQGNLWRGSGTIAVSKFGTAVLFIPDPRIFSFRIPDPIHKKREAKFNYYLATYCSRSKSSFIKIIEKGFKSEF
jgi:hypothetical protein